MTSKQRATLRCYANELETILQVGKGGVTETVLAQADSALEARELMKLKTLENAPVTAREAAAELADKLGAEVVQVIGAKAVLFRRRKKDSKFSDL